MATEARLRANRRYERQSVKRVSLAFFPDDMQVYRYLCTHENRSGFIKDLIRRAMENDRKASKNE